MKSINVSNVSADQSGDYFQILFEQGEIYFLIQYGDEFDGPEFEFRYIESDDEFYIGHVVVVESRLSNENFYIKVRDQNETKELEISFPPQREKEFVKLKRVLKVIAPNVIIENQ